MSHDFEVVDSAAVTDAQLAAFHAFQQAIHAERLPEDPPLPFGAAVRQLKNPAPNTRTRGFAASRDGRWVAVGFGVFADGDEQNLRVELAVLPEHRRHGLGRELLSRLANLAEAAGREVLIGDSYDRSPAGAAFAERVGAEAGMRGHVNRLAMVDVDRATVQRWIDEGPARAPGYELVAFDSPIPDDLIGDVAEIINVINDAPTDDLQTAPVKLTGEMVRAFEGIGLAAGLEVWWLLAKERSSGAVVGETDVRWDPKQPHTITQGTTVVRAEHRGHALGKWLKATMLQRVLAERPDVLDVRTSNADSNAPMVGINTELGYRPYIGTTTWQLPVGAVQRSGSS